jgi:hypothetical protein
VANATNRYKQIAGLEDVTRYVLLEDGTYFVMVDHLAAATPHVYEWTSHFGESVTLDNRWLWGSAGDDQGIAVGIAAPQHFPFASGNDGAPYIRIRPVTPVTDTLFVNLLYPTTTAELARSPTVEWLQARKRSVALQVKDHASMEQTDDILLVYQPGVNRAVGPYHFDGQLAVIRRTAQGEIEKLFLVGGTTLKVAESGTVLWQTTEPQEAVEVTYPNKDISITSPLTSTIMLNAPRVDKLLSNGLAQPYARDGQQIRTSGSEFKVYLPYITR